MNFFSAENEKFEITQNMIDSSTLLTSLSTYKYENTVLDIKSNFLELIISFNKKFPTKTPLLPVSGEKTGDFQLPKFNNFKDMNLSVVHSKFKDKELEFFNEMSISFLYELTNAANYLGYLHFVEVICKKIAMILNSQSLEKAVQFFKLEDDEIKNTDLQWLP